MRNNSGISDAGNEEIREAKNLHLVPDEVDLVNYEVWGRESAG
ncbi:hypothetical protein [Taibaiella lutea]|nr:hypothetical protein [Taibaiella lutea]